LLAHQNSREGAAVLGWRHAYFKSMAFAGLMPNCGRIFRRF
jgi:hypothetical protein